MVANIMNLSMAVVTTCYTVVSTGFYYLVKFEFAIGATFFLESRLKKTATTTTTVVIGSVGGHFDDVLFANNLFNHVAQVLGYGFAISFSYYLAGILDGKLHLSLFVPVRIHLQSTLTDPFGVVLVDGSYFKVVIYIEFFQSGPD
jgi:hypothetical protein